jgi:hypothetical protein
MKKITNIIFFSLLFVLVIYPLHADIFIHNELNETDHEIENAWIGAGANAPNGVEAIPEPTLIYHVAIISDSSAIYNANVFNQLLQTLNDPANTVMREILIPAGNFSISDSLNLPSNLIIKGEGAGVTVLRFIVPSIDYSQSGLPSGRTFNAFEMRGVNHTGIEDLTIQRYCTPTLITTNDVTVWTNGDCYFHDQLLNDSNMNKGDNIYITGTVDPSTGISNCHDNWVTGVESDRPLRHHIIIDNSQNITISGCYFNDVQLRGQGGFGYGVNL